MPNNYTIEDIRQRLTDLLKDCEQDIIMAKQKATGISIHDINCCSANLHYWQFDINKNGSKWKLRNWATAYEYCKTALFRLKLLAAGVTPKEAYERAKRGI